MAIARSVIWLNTWTGRSVGSRLYRSTLNQKRAVSGHSVAPESRCLVPWVTEVVMALMRPIPPKASFLFVSPHKPGLDG